MSISFACAECGEEYTVGDELAGKKGRCHRCGSYYDIPYQSALQPAGAPGAVKKPSVYGFTPKQTGVRDKKPPRVKYPTLYEDRASWRNRSRLMPLGILLLVMLAGTAYLHRDFLRTWFEEDVKEEFEQVREKLTGEHEHEKAK